MRRSPPNNCGAFQFERNPLDRPPFASYHDGVLGWIADPAVRGQPGIGVTSEWNKIGRTDGCP